jgi:hypothetical protein
MRHGTGPPHAQTAPGKRSAWTLGAALALASVAGGLFAGQLVAGGHTAAVLALALVVLPVALWKRPQLGPAVLLVAAVTIEQFRYMVGPRSGAITDRIPLFHGVGGGIHVNPIDLLLLVLFVITLLKGGTEARGRWPRSVVTAAISGLLVVVAIGVVVGRANGGELRTAFTEVRPYVYLALAYVLSAVLLTTREALRTMLWGLVLGAGFKAGLGVVIFLSVRHVSPRPEAVLGHEEAFFFGLFVLLTLALWLFEVPGRLRTTATFLLPVVLVADLVNTRRVAFLILGVGLVALIVIGFVCVPRRRPFLRRLAVVIALGAAVYLPVYWGNTGALAQPARAIHSAISPDPRDELSDLYRTQENANLRLNIEQGGLLGKGFGVPIDYALPIADISSANPLIAYIPHNGVLYVFMRMGILGSIALWALLAVGIIAGCRLARAADRELAVVGALVACALFAYAIQGYNDQGFFFYRIAFAVGCLLGMCEVASGLAAAASKVPRVGWRPPGSPPIGAKS